MRRPRRAAALFLLTLTGLALSGCSPPESEPRLAGRAAPTLPARGLPTGTGETGPARPEQQKPYPYDIYTHCGIKWVSFGGRWWVLDTVFPGAEQVQGKPAPPHQQWIAGYMTLIGPDTATFDAAGMPSLQFIPAQGDPPGCA
ncbi:hypothetical protein ACFVIM_14775 [Streptomyces sp. NPDC057638]|uniref:hypothetical protein n=1 Tax=Streptomyces sp. NPDC057638 TaxID=3346190 RepID=UPI0036A595BC